MEFGEFSDISLDNTDQNNFHSCDDVSSELDDSGLWTNTLLNSSSPTENDHFNSDIITDLTRTGADEQKQLGSEHSSISNGGTESIHKELVTAEEDEQSLRTQRFGSDSHFDLSSDISCNTQSGCSSDHHHQFSKRSSRSSFDELLFELYDRHGCHTPRNSISLDSSSTDYSSLSECHHLKSSSESVTLHTASNLQSNDVFELQDIVNDLTNKIAQKNVQLVKCLRNRERHRIKEAKHCDMITAILQAWSSKTSLDAKMKFSLEPIPGEGSFQQWRDAIAAVTRRPIGLPSHFRHKVWLSLASEYIQSLHLDWDKVVQFAFNDKCNPDDDALGTQIVKDLHRTGCSSFSGIENEDDRAVLQRVLLGYARWNKVTGYCQGFNILAALILDVTKKNEIDALKIMIYLVDKVLPKEYFAHNLRALTVDMAVFRSYLSMKLPRLSAHLLRLQEEALDTSTGRSVEPPLTNVFTMQWFLTMFATCLPVETVLKIWDCVMIDGSEILIRTALALWTKLAKNVIKVKSADQFYMTMGSLSQQLLAGTVISSNELIENIYKMAPLPLPKLHSLREKFMYDITPFSAAMNSASHSAAYSEEEGGDDIHEIAKKGGLNTDYNAIKSYQSMDVNLLKKQYSKLIQRQRQARVLMRVVSSPDREDTGISAKSTPIAMNHLFVGKKLSEGKRLDTVSRASKLVRSKSHNTTAESSHVKTDSIKANTPHLSDELSTRLDMYATTQQEPRQTLRYKYKKNKAVINNQPNESRGQHVTADERLESAIIEGLKRNSLICHSTHSNESGSPSDDSTEFPQRDESSQNEELTRKQSNASTTLSDDVFLSGSPSHSHQNLTNHQLTQKLNSKNTEKPSDYISNSVNNNYKPFNPFPKPVTGLLTADKAKIGVRLGLYTTRDALTYMTPTQRRQFLKTEATNQRYVAGSRSSMW